MENVYVTIYTKEKGMLEFSFSDWYVFDKKSITIHRKDGPAVIYRSGCKEYKINNKFHRTDGPAVIWLDKRVSYYIDDDRCLEEEFNKIINEARKLSKTERLIDERWWVREL